MNSVSLLCPELRAKQTESTVNLDKLPTPDLLAKLYVDSLRHGNKNFHHLH